MNTSDGHRLPGFDPGQWTALFDALPGHVFIASRNGDFLYVNPAWERLTGRSAQSLLGSSWVSLLNPEDRERVTEDWARMIEHLSSFQSVHHLVVETGQVRVKMQAAPVRHDEQVLAFVGSVSEWDGPELGHKTLAHDMRNILTVVGSHLRRDAGTPDPDERAAALDAIDRACSMMDELTGQVAKRQAVALNQLAERVLAAVRPCLPASLNAQVRTDPSLSTGVIDSALTYRALMNLVVNAIEAMPTGGDLGLETLRLRDPERVRFTVRDTGRGLPEGRAFELGFSTRSGGGVRGLGLSVVDTCARVHGGRVRAESRPGSGTAMHLELPI